VAKVAVENVGCGVDREQRLIAGREQDDQHAARLREIDRVLDRHAGLFSDSRHAKRRALKSAELAEPVRG
jgi:hypothetical protein